MNLEVGVTIMDSQIKCPHCGQQFPLDQVFKTQITEELRRDAETQFDQKLQEAKRQAKAEAAKALEIQMQEQAKDRDTLESANEKLTEDYVKINEQLRSLKQKAASQAKIVDEKVNEKLAEERVRLQQEVLEDAHLKDKQKDKQIEESKETIRKLEMEVAKAKKGLDQKTGQLQGEVLELDIEERLKQTFLYDDICEVKKGQKGADVHQVVKDKQGQSAGLIVWEAKNAIWQTRWLDKLKEDMAAAKAHIGVLVSVQIPEDREDLSQEDGNIWVVSPRLAIALARILRQTLLDIKQVSSHSQLKDDQMKSLHDYITSPEFRHKVGAMLDTYDKWRVDLDKERRWMTLKWGRQEKMIDKLTTNTLSIHSDFQGITGDALLELPHTQLSEEDDDVMPEPDQRELDVI